MVTSGFSVPAHPAEGWTPKQRQLRVLEVPAQTPHHKPWSAGKLSTGIPIQAMPHQPGLGKWGIHRNSQSSEGKPPQPSVSSLFACPRLHTQLQPPDSSGMHNYLLGSSARRGGSNSPKHILVPSQTFIYLDLFNLQIHLSTDIYFSIQIHLSIDLFRSTPLFRFIQRFIQIY